MYVIELPLLIQSFISIFAILVSIGLLIEIATFFEYSIKQYLLYILMASFIVVEFVLAYAFKYSLDHSLMMVSLLVPFIIHMLLIFIGFGIFIYCFYIIHSYRKEHITEQSIRDGFDSLPVGICCYDEIGEVYMVNHKMNMISQVVLNEYLSNMNYFLKALEDYKIEMGLGELYQINESIYRFDCVNIDDKFKELLAVDVTFIVSMNKEYQNDTKKLKEINSRLNLYSKEIDEVVKKEELLAARINIHGNLGKILLEARRFLVEGEIDDFDDFINRWKQTVQLLKKDAHNEIEPFKELQNAAHYLGVEIQLNGKMPQDSKTLKLMVSATRECLTNAIQHAQAKTLFITVQSNEHTTTISFENDGILPQKIIKEGGGLSSLRDVVESNGAKMKIESVPRFVLRIEV